MPIKQGLSRKGVPIPESSKAGCLGSDPNWMSNFSQLWALLGSTYVRLIEIWGIASTA